MNALGKIIKSKNLGVQQYLEITKYNNIRYVKNIINVYNPTLIKL